MTEVLKLKSHAGDFVHENQNMASGQGFKCVSRIWYEKTIPLSAGIDKINDAARAREDFLLPISAVKYDLNSDGKFVVEINGRQYLPTEHCMGHIATWNYVPHGFMNAYRADPVVNGKTVFKRDGADRELLLAVFNNGKRRIEKDKQFRWRTYNDGTLRAMLSEIYGTINNTWYLETLQSLFKTIGGDEPRLSHWRGDADTIYGNLLIPDTCVADKDSDYGGMISMSNCEIRKRRFSQYPSIFRAICMNGCIWDQSKGNIIEKVHRGEIDLNELTISLTENVHRQIPLMGDAVQRFLRTRELRLAAVSPSNVFATVALENRFTPAQARNVAEEFVNHESENRNLFGVINSITRAAQRNENEDWVRFDEVAGNLMVLTQNRWEALLGRAQNLEKAQVEKAFGVAV